MYFPLCIQKTLINCNLHFLNNISEKCNDYLYLKFTSYIFNNIFCVIKGIISYSVRICFRKPTKPSLSKSAMHMNDIAT